MNFTEVDIDEEVLGIVSAIPGSVVVYGVMPNDELKRLEAWVPGDGPLDWDEILEREVDAWRGDHP
jgi:hypothetical protein